MARLLKTKKEEVGLSPDEYHFRGEIKTEKITLRIIDYQADELSELNIESVADAAQYNETDTTSWFNIDGLHDKKVMHEIAESFDLERMILSDVMNTHVRPKMHEYDNCIFISLKMMQFDEQLEKVTAENLVIIIKEKIVLTFQEKKGSVFEPIRERIRNNKKRIRRSGTDYLAFALMDIIFDNYKYVTSQIGEKIELLEVDLLNNPDASILEEINFYKKEIIYLHKSIKPCREIVLDMLKMDSDLLHDTVYIHLEELKNNINQSIESLESYREILSDQLNIYHTTISSKLNDIMKFLTIFSVIFIPLTFIAGVYGTNFDFLPELHFKYSYFIMLGIMLIIALVMIAYFRRKKWF